jgi:uncharacterized protein YacL
MSANLISRIVGLVAVIIIVLLVEFDRFGRAIFRQPMPWLLETAGIAIGAGLVALLIAPYVSVIPYRWIRDQIRRAAASDLLAAALGLMVGLIIAALLAIPLAQLSFLKLGQILPTIAALFFGYLGVTVAVLRKNDLAHLFQGISNTRRANRSERDEREQEERDNGVSSGRNGRTQRDGKYTTRQSDRILLDTSAIIDGRIADISQTGFITGTLVVPRFVLEELQHIADSPDTLRRNRGRRGLEILNRLQKEASVPVEITDADIEGVTEVDAKLVKMARNLHCPIITNDFNLNRVAELQGVKVLNMNELANALKPVLLPGEDTQVKIIQDGKELGQGIAYLDDGTMIVVEGGRQHMNRTIDVTVTRVIQTVAGRMIFAHPKETNGNRK